MVEWLMITVEGSMNLFCSTKFPRARKRISKKFIYNLGERPSKGSTALRQKNSADVPCATGVGVFVPFSRRIASNYQQPAQTKV
jgi:hypothetical protein